MSRCHRIVVLAVAALFGLSLGLARLPAANAQGGEPSPPKGDVKSGKKKSGSHATHQNKSELQFRGDDRLRARS